MELSLPSDWTRSVGPGGLHIYGAPEPGLSILVWPLQPRIGTDVRAFLGVNRPPISRLRVVQSMDLATESGWHIHLLTGLVDHALGVETRLGAVYEVLHWVGFVLAIGTDAAVYAAYRERLVTWLVAARPNLQGDEPLCVKDLFDLSGLDEGPR